MIMGKYIQLKDTKLQEDNVSVGIKLNVEFLAHTCSIYSAEKNSPLI